MSDIARDDLALDSLAAGRRPEGDDEVLGLLGALRTDLEPPAPAPAPATVVPLRRRRRPVTLIALSAAAGLVAGALATGAVVTSDEPGELFYAAHKAVLGDPHAADTVTRLLDDAAEELAEGDRRGALRRLQDARARLDDVADPAQRRPLEERIDRLAAIAAAPAPTPSATPSADDDRGDDRETPEPRETDDPDDDPDDSGNSGSGSGDPDDSDNSGSGSSGSGSSDSGSSGSDSGSSGKGSDDVLKTLDPDDSGGHGGDDGD